MGTLAAFAFFAVVTALVQNIYGGKAVDPGSAVRLENKANVAKEQDALIEKYGLKGDSTAVFEKAQAVIKTRQVKTTTQVVPGTPTALKQAAPAPAPAPAAPAPATTPVPAAPAPAAAPAAPVPTPAAPAAVEQK